jgi:SAM-dependent methyltransferase
VAVVIGVVVVPIVARACVHAPLSVVAGLSGMPTFGHIEHMNAILFDRALVQRRRARAEAGADFLLTAAAGDLELRLGTVLRTFDTAVDLGTPTSAFAEALARTGKADRIVRVGAAGTGAAVIADEEALPFATASLGLVVSGLALHWVNDLPGTLVQVRRALKPDGLFMAAMLGGQTLWELRDAFAAAEAEVEGGISPRVSPFAEVRDLGGLLQRAGFALPVTDVDRLTVRYADAFALMRDLRAMGGANALVERRRTPLRRETLFRMAAIYAERHAAPDGRIPATFDVVWLSGWAPHDSQPKPLRPGSATARLADALGTVEHTMAPDEPGR